ncbi:MAG: PadR family transcriptional regulator [Bacillota bacterium]|nr:helix-turn-helix transcriptional regulator [Bacillota bacterium]
MKEDHQNPDYTYITGRLDKMLVPSLLYFLSQRPSHGYELIQKFNDSGFSEVEADPATIYRNLRRMEEDGLVISKWETDQSGPARRAYVLTPEGEQALAYCVELINDKVGKLNAFLDEYNRRIKGGRE